MILVLYHIRLQVQYFLLSNIGLAEANSLQTDALLLQWEKLYFSV